MFRQYVIRSQYAATLFALLILLAPIESFAASKNGFVLDDALVPAKQILSGGPGRDGIPSLDYPAFIVARNADYLNEEDRILGIEVNGVARAYPIRILNYHEIVNDIVGGEAIVVTYCPLCGSGMAFNAEINNKSFEFGVSGLLYNSDVLLYDRQTGSLWSQILKTSVSGARQRMCCRRRPATDEIIGLTRTPVIAAAENYIFLFRKKVDFTAEKHWSWAWKSMANLKLIHLQSCRKAPDDSLMNSTVRASKCCMTVPTKQPGFLLRTATKCRH